MVNHLQELHKIPCLEKETNVRVIYCDVAGTFQVLREKPPIAPTFRIFWNHYMTGLRGDFIKLGPRVLRIIVNRGFLDSSFFVSGFRAGKVGYWISSGVRTV